jgi:hypothetical protein
VNQLPVIDPSSHRTVAMRCVERLVVNEIEVFVDEVPNAKLFRVFTAPGAPQAAAF